MLLVESREGIFALVLSYWLISIVLLTTALSLWYPLHRHAFRLRRGLCLRCAYDLRATSPDEPCPECGTPG